MSGVGARSEFPVGKEVVTHKEAHARDKAEKRALSKRDEGFEKRGGRSARRWWKSLFRKDR